MSQGFGTILSSFWQANATPISLGRSQWCRCLRNAKHRSKYPPPMPIRLQSSSNATNGVMTTSIALGEIISPATGSQSPNEFRISGVSGCISRNVIPRWWQPGHFSRLNSLYSEYFFLSIIFFLNGIRKLFHKYSMLFWWKVNYSEWKLKFYSF